MSPESVGKPIRYPGELVARGVRQDCMASVEDLKEFAAQEEEWAKQQKSLGDERDILLADADELPVVTIHPLGPTDDPEVLAWVARMDRREARRRRRQVGVWLTRTVSLK
jgi:hypothetical protein